MSKAFDLPRIPPPPPAPEPKLCLACKAFRAECVAPVGESSAPMCWACAHHVVEHDCPPHLAAEARCECLPREIYPYRAEAEDMWDGLYAACGIDNHPPASTEKQRSIEEINADIARCTLEIQRLMPMREHEDRFKKILAEMTPAQRKIYEGSYLPFRRQCCPRDHNYDGNCDVHPRSATVAPVAQHGVRRKP